MLKNVAAGGPKAKQSSVAAVQPLIYVASILLIG